MTEVGRVRCVVAALRDAWGVSVQHACICGHGARNGVVCHGVYSALLGSK